MRARSYDCFVRSSFMRELLDDFMMTFHVVSSKTLSSQHIVNCTHWKSSYTRTNVYKHAGHLIVSDLGYNGQFIVYCTACFELLGWIRLSVLVNEVDQ